MKYRAEISSPLNARKEKPQSKAWVVTAWSQANRALLALLICATPSLAQAGATAMASAQSNTPPRLITSVQPVQMIVSAISHGISTPIVLLPPGSTPHEYSLKPSNVKHISQADALFWIGPSLENFLSRTLKKFSRRSSLNVSALIDAPGLKLISLNDEHHHEHDHAQHDDAANTVAEHSDDAKAAEPAEHAAEHSDPHIWLDPDNALAMARQVSQVLANLDPANAKRYQHNLSEFAQRIAKLHKQLQHKLMPIKNKGYFVFHDAYSYFEQRYGLKRLGEFSVNESKPSVKKLMSIQSIIQQGQAECVFSEPQFNPSLIHTVIRGTNVRQATLDPLGDSYQYGVDPSNHYFEFIEQFTNQFIGCLNQ
ncbi:MAG: zinc ABC transporter substrate-binding protein ZnuA [Pseudomonadales bacterium]|nr:zinc ABC transporter substrate-binding protein ZnuA [Pseudomonadales bacterium]